MLSFRLKKQTSKNVADTIFNVMIGLALSGRVHNKGGKIGINSILLPLVFGTYSYISYFVIPVCFLKFSTPS